MLIGQLRRLVVCLLLEKSGLVSLCHSRKFNIQERVIGVDLVGFLFK